MTDEFLKRFEENRKAREQADRSFELLGETLTFRATIPYETPQDLERVRRQFADGLLEAQKRIDAANGNAPDFSDLMLDADALVHAADAQIIRCLEPGSREAWARLRALDADEPLSFYEIGQIADYLLGRVTRIPTVAPAGSSGGRKTTGSKSTDASSSTAKTSKG